MTTQLPLASGGLVRVDGAPLAPELAALLVLLRVRDDRRLPDQAQLRLADPQLAHVDDESLSVGRTLEVLLAPPGAATATAVFSGRIESIELELAHGGAFLAATAYEPAFVLHGQRRTRAFQSMSSGEIAAQVIQAAGLQASVGGSAASGEVHPFVLQREETDWQLLWRLADAIDFEVAGEGATVHFRPAGSGARGEPLPLRAPEQLLRFRPRIAAAPQVAEVEVRGWDPASAEAIVASESTPPPDSSPGGVAGSTAAGHGAAAGGGGTATGGGGTATGGGDTDAGGSGAQAGDGGTWTVGDRAVLSHDEAGALAGSLAARLANAAVTADGIAVGDPRLRAGARVQVSGVGARFGGLYTLSSTTHVLSGGRGYETHFAVSGRGADTIATLLHGGPAALLHGETAALPHSGPAAPRWGAGVVVGVVTQTEDPEGLGRVRVQHPALGEDAEGWWARIAAPAAGAGRGLLMMPLAGDEVVLAFEQGDPRRPYVLGAVWNGQATPGDLVRRDGSCALSSDHDIDLAAAGKVSLTAQDAMTLTGAKGVSLRAREKLELGGGTSVTLEADGSLTVKGADVSVQASGTVRISGSQVMLG